MYNNKLLSLCNGYNYPEIKKKQQVNYNLVRIPNLSVKKNP